MRLKKHLVVISILLVIIGVLLVLPGEVSSYTVKKGEFGIYEGLPSCACPSPIADCNCILPN